MAEIEKVRIVSISTQIKAAAAMFLDKPHLASRYYGRLLKDLDGIFNEDHKLLPYYTCTYLLYKLEYSFRNKIIPAQYRKYRFHILMLFKYDFAKETVPELNSNKMEKLCEEILQCINDAHSFQVEVQRLIEVIQNCVSDIDDTEMTKSVSLLEDLKKELKK